MKKGFEDIIKGKLYAHRQLPPEQVWGRIQKSLEDADATERNISAVAAGGIKQIKRKERSSSQRLVLYGIAALLLIGFVTTFFVQRFEKEKDYVVEKKADSSYALPQVVEKSRPDNVEQARVETDNKLATVNRYHAETMTDSNNNKEHTASTGRQDQNIEQGEREIKTEMPDKEPVTTTRKKNVTSYYPDIQSYARNRKRRPAMSASLFAANNGGGNNMKVQGSSKINEVYSRGDNQQVMALSAPSLNSVHHRPPVSIGIDISIDILSSLSIESGATYTYLQSDYDASGSISEYSTVQQLHYIGVPLALKYKFINGSLFDLYLRGGGMLEKGIYGTSTTSISSSTVKDRSVVKMNGLQPSLFASVGCQWDITRIMGIYVEPGINYYPLRENQPESYRTKNPLTFSLRAGVRFNITKP